MQLIGSVNGLVCFGGGGGGTHDHDHDDSLEIYNIFAGTNYYLSPPIFVISPFYKEDPDEYGDPIFEFGYDPISNDYKILRIEHFYSWSIYSFATNSWKNMTIERNNFRVYYNLKGRSSVCIDGVIYWPPGDDRDNIRRYYGKIIMFDHHIEKFKLIRLPKEDLLLPTQYADIQLLSFRGCLAFAFIKTTTTTTTTTTKSRKRKRSGGGRGDGEIWVELFTLNLYNKKNKQVAWKSTNLWKIKSFVVQIPVLPKEVEFVSCCEEIFLGWFESNQLRLCNLHTKRIFNLPLSTSPSHYYPKASFMERKKKDNPTYVDNLSFDFSLI